MTIRRVDRSEWSGFCVRVSRGYLGKHARIEVVSPDIGFQLEADSVPLIGMVYDPKDDVLELIVGDHDHLIWRPRELYVDEARDFSEVSLEIVDDDGVHQIVTLHDPRMLPPPQYFRQ